VAAEIGLPLKDVRRAWAAVRERFCHNIDLRLTDPRQERERAVAKSMSEQASQAAEKKHKQPKRDACGRSADAVLRAYESESVLSCIEKPLSKSNGYGALANWQKDESFSLFVAQAMIFWPDLLTEDLQISWLVWKHFDFEQKAKAVQILTERIEIAQDSRYVKRPPKYLESGEWKRKPRPPEIEERHISNRPHPGLMMRVANED
jgi:hypothetical protein